MNLQSLRTFLIAAENESMTAAADELLYAQSTVTTHIKQLEAEWNVTLFRKEGRGVRLTSEGRAILAKVKTIIQSMEALNETIRSVDVGCAGHLRIAAIEPIGSHLIAPLLAQFSKTRPLLQLNYETGSYYAISGRYERQELEIAITQRPDSTYPLPFEALFTERIQLLIREDHPLARAEKIRIEDLNSERLIFTETIWAYQGIIEAGLVYYGGMNPYAGIEINSIHAAMTFVERGVGMALLPDYCLSIIPNTTVIREIEGNPFSREVGYLHRGFHLKDESAVVQDFLKLIKSRLKR